MDIACSLKWGTRTYPAATILAPSAARVNGEGLTPAAPISGSDP